MRDEIICIECPKGCKLRYFKDDKGECQVTGNKCIRGFKYIQEEVVDPRRILTSVVKAQGLVEQMVPVRTNQGISKEQLLPAMEVVKSIVLDKSINCGEILVKDFLDQVGTNLIATRTISKQL